MSEPTRTAPPVVDDGPAAPAAAAAATAAPAPAVPAATHSHRDTLWSPQRRALTVGLILNITIVASEALAVSTIMPIVAEDLGGIDLYGWVFSGFFLGNLLGIVVAGILIDRGGLSRPFLLGIGLFSLGLLIGGLAPTMAILVVARIVQGFGAGAIPAVGYVAIGRALPERLRPQMFAFLSTAWVIPGVIGPTIAGLVAENLHWRLVFLGLLPLIAVAVALTLPAIRAVRPAPDAADGEHRVALDARRRLPLAVVLVAGAGLTVSGLSSIGPAPLVLLAAGVPIGAWAFARVTPPGTLRARPVLPAAILLRGFLTFAFFCSDAYVPLAVQSWRGYPAVVSGLVLTAATLSWTGGSWILAQQIGRFGPIRFLRLGFVVLILGIAGVSTILIPTVPIIVAVVMWSVTGLAMGLSYSTPSLITLAEALPEEQGAATAALQLSDVLGTALGTGLGGALVVAGSPPGGLDWPGLAATFAASAIVAFAGLLLTARFRRVRRPVAARAEAPAAG